MKHGISFSLNDER
jgi:SAGA-associated factor 29